jgi:hypothetical protein
MTWSLANDFRAAPNETNPAPDSYGHPKVWSYMRSEGNAHDPTTYHLLRSPLPPDPPDNFQTNEAGVPGLEDWYDRANCPATPADCFPHVGKNTTGVNQGLNQACVRTPPYYVLHCYPTISWPAGTMLIHPYTTQMAVVGWTSPVTARVTMTASFQSAELVNCGNGIQWTLDRGATTLIRAQVTPLQTGEGSPSPSVFRPSKPST